MKFILVVIILNTGPWGNPATVDVTVSPFKNREACEAVGSFVKLKVEKMSRQEAEWTCLHVRDWG